MELSGLLWHLRFHFGGLAHHLDRPRGGPGGRSELVHRGLQRLGTLRADGADGLWPGSRAAALLEPGRSPAAAAGAIFKTEPAVQISGKRGGQNSQVLTGTSAKVYKWLIFHVCLPDSI